MAFKGPAPQVIAYHYTCVEHLPKILEDGYLKVTESNISLKKKDAGPRVVWLSKKPDLAITRDSGLQYMTLVDKYAVRFQLALPRREVMPWHDWAKRHGCAQTTVDALAKASGSHSWLVIERPVILPRECLSIINTNTGEIYFER